MNTPLIHNEIIVSIIILWVVGLCEWSLCYLHTHKDMFNVSSNLVENWMVVMRLSNLKLTIPQYMYFPSRILHDVICPRQSFDFPLEMGVRLHPGPCMISYGEARPICWWEFLCPHQMSLINRLDSPLTLFKKKLNKSYLEIWYY